LVIGYEHAIIKIKLKEDEAGLSLSKLVSKLETRKLPSCRSSFAGVEAGIETGAFLAFSV